MPRTTATLRRTAAAVAALPAMAMQAAAQAPDDVAALARAAQNPVAAMISVPLQNNTSFRMGAYDAANNALNIQPVIPLTLNADWNLITRTVVPVPFQPRMGGAIKLTERRLAEGTLWHAGQPLMAWCVGNAKVEPKGNALLITKQASGTAKIDPLMALFNAAELMARAPEPEPRSFYDDPESMRIAFGGSVDGEDDDDHRRWRRVW